MTDAHESRDVTSSASDAYNRGSPFLISTSKKIILYSGGLAPQTRKAEHVEGRVEGGETRGRKGHVGEKAMSVKRPCILQTTRYVLPKRILSENLSFVTRPRSSP